MNLVPFFLTAAFADDPFGGNPAVVVFHDTSLPLEELGKIARNFNQPIFVVVSSHSLTSESGDNNLERRSIRFISPRGDIEVPICGHGTLAAAKATFELLEVTSAGKKSIQFETAFGKQLEATKSEDGWIEITIPSTVPGDIDGQEMKRLKGFVDSAFGRDVNIKNMKTGGIVYKAYIMVEIDESEDLAHSLLDAKALIGNGYEVNIFTSSSRDAEYVFVSRMFAPSALVDAEDHVCGSAHGVLTPYWSTKLGLMPGEEIKVRQVSKRGGELKLVWNIDKNTLRIRGQCTIIATGELALPTA